MAFAQLVDLEDRLEWDLSDEEKRVGLSAIQDLTDEARSIGKDWTDDTVPRVVRKAVLAAAVRYMRNLEGVITSRAADEAVGFAETEGMGSPQFTRSEVERISATAIGVNGFGTIPIVAWGEGKRTSTDYVPTDNTPFPFFNGDQL